VSVTGQIADRIRLLRLERRWSARELADECARAGVSSLSRATIAKIETGLRKSLRPDEVAVLARVLGIDPGDLTSPDAAEGQERAVQEILTDLDVAPGVCPAQLPPDIGDFTGRETHVELLSTLLFGGDTTSSPGAVRIAVVNGAAGLGKTTLAVHAAHQVSAQFPDGQLYVDLRGASPQPTSPGEALARFLRDLGIAGDKIPAGDDERTALYRTILKGRRMLILLDNAKNAAQVRPLLPGSSTCAVLITTRNRAADLESTRLVDLNVLDDTEALVLFTRIVGEERTAAEPDATAEVLVACAGLPLAIRICAARLAGRRQWKIATLARRLGNQHRRLDELKTGDLAVRASFQVSYDSLKTPSRGTDSAHAFRLLGLWQGASISLPAAAALIGEPEDDIADVLETLVDANLLESPAPDWYRFHDLLRVYATERVQEEEPQTAKEEAVARLLRWYLDTAEIAANTVAPQRYQVPWESVGPDYPPLAFSDLIEALAWFDDERPNITAATRQAAAVGLHDIAWRLPATLFPLFNRRGNWTDCITTHRVAVESARKTGDRVGEAWVLSQLGSALVRMRDPEALDQLEQALAIHRELGDTRGMAQTAIGLAEGYLNFHGPSEDAIRYLQLAVDLLRPTGATSLLAVALNNLGKVYFRLGNLDRAEDCYIQARDISRGIGGHVKGHALHNLARVYQRQRRLDEAAASYEEALREHRASGMLLGEAMSLKNLGVLHMEAGNEDRGREYLIAALNLFERIGDPAEAANVRSVLGSGDTAATTLILDHQSNQASADNPGIQEEAVDDVLFGYLGPHPERAPLRASSIRFRILGPLEVWAGEWIPISAPRWRSLLALLLLSAGEAVAVDELIAETWGDDSPTQAANLISIYAHRLRRVIGDTDGKVLVYRAPGYLLRVGKEEVDAYAFESLVNEAKEALATGDAAIADSVLTEALGLWRGHALADLHESPAIKAEAERLERLRSEAIQLHVEASTASDGKDQILRLSGRLVCTVIHDEDEGVFRGEHVRAWIRPRWR
jgi:tetratricopeptide (TPR) repeat protein/transcriptional regulator with XRE-family HTH domain